MLVAAVNLGCFHFFTLSRAGKSTGGGDGGRLGVRGRLKDVRLRLFNRARRSNPIDGPLLFARLPGDLGPTHYFYVSHPYAQGCKRDDADDDLYKKNEDALPFPDQVRLHSSSSTRLVKFDLMSRRGILELQRAP